MASTVKHWGHDKNIKWGIIFFQKPCRNYPGRRRFGHLSLNRWFHNINVESVETHSESPRCRWHGLRPPLMLKCSNHAYKGVRCAPDSYVVYRVLIVTVFLSLIVTFYLNRSLHKPVWKKRTVVKKNEFGQPMINPITLHININPTSFRTHQFRDMPPNETQNHISTMNMDL